VNIYAPFTNETAGYYTTGLLLTVYLTTAQAD